MKSSVFAYFIAPNIVPSSSVTQCSIFAGLMPRLNSNSLCLIPFSEPSAPFSKNITYHVEMTFLMICLMALFAQETHFILSHDQRIGNAKVTPLTIQQTVYSIRVANETTLFTPSSSQQFNDIPIVTHSPSSTCPVLIFFNPIGEFSKNKDRICTIRISWKPWSLPFSSLVSSRFTIASHHSSCTHWKNFSGSSLLILNSRTEMQSSETSIQYKNILHVIEFGEDWHNMTERKRSKSKLSEKKPRAVGRWSGEEKKMKIQWSAICSDPENPNDCIECSTIMLQLRKSYFLAANVPERKTGSENGDANAKLVSFSETKTVCYSLLQNLRIHSFF